MAAKAKKGVRLARAAKRRKQPAMKLGYKKSHGKDWTRKDLSELKRLARVRVQLKAADFERTVIYRGIKIKPMMAAGKRSRLARAIRDDLRTARRGKPV
jgi:hypothetical protein